MTVDRYTKALLTVIAACLVWLSFGGPSLLPTVSAQDQGVVLIGWRDEGGVVRPFPANRAVPAPAAGRPNAPAPFPVRDFQ
jgi:hypothetical protein